jgi:hypothetical protein
MIAGMADGKGWAALVLALALAGCTPELSELPVQTVVAPPSAGKLPLRVALVMAPQAVTDATYQELENPCLGHFWSESMQLGKTFEADAMSAFTAAFQSARLVRAASEAKDEDAILEPRLVKFGFRPGCLGDNFVDVFIAEGALRAVAADGQELWRGTATSNRIENGVPWTLSPAEAYAQIAHDGSQAMAGLIAAWIAELRGLDVGRYAAVPRAGLDEALAKGAEAEKCGDWPGAVAIYTEALQHYSRSGFVRLSDLVDRAIDAALKQDRRPAIPDAAAKHALAAQNAVKGAKTIDDLRTARQEFQNALALAPWWADAWVDLSLVDEQVQSAAAARRDLAWYLRAAPDAPDRAAVERKMNELDVKAGR